MDQQGFVRLTFPNYVEINGTQAYKIYESRLELDAAIPQLLFVDLTSNPRPDREARQFVKSKEAISCTQAIACLVDGLLSKMVGNLLLSVTNGKIPTKLFGSEDEAVKWLLDQKKEAED